MKSGAAHHFPPLVFRNGKKILWNRIEKKPLANRPEERVRLRFIDYLTLECGWPSSRIGSEQTIADRDGTPRLRADLICFDKSFKPSLLIECKAESIPLNQKTAEQIALYNRHVHAPHLCITNGINDFWFETGNGGIRTLARPPLETGAAKPAAGLDYWVARGFAGRNALKHNGTDFAEILRNFWSGDGFLKVRYLDIGHATSELQFDHYYKVTDIDNDVRIAVTFMAGHTGDTYLTAIYNHCGTNKALLFINLDSVKGQRTDNAVLVSGSRQCRLDLRGKIPAAIAMAQGKSPGGETENLPEILLSIFRQDV